MRNALDVWVCLKCIVSARSYHFDAHVISFCLRESDAPDIRNSVRYFELRQSRMLTRVLRVGCLPERVFALFHPMLMIRNVLITVMGMAMRPRIVNVFTQSSTSGEVWIL